MAILKNLKLANAEPVRAQTDPVMRARDKVVEALVEQKRAAEAKIAGQHYAPTQKVWRTNEAGERVLVEARKRFRNGWFENAAGQTFFALRYAGKTIPLDDKGRNAIEVGDVAKLPAIIDTLIEAVQAGELDGQLAAAAEARGLTLRRKAA